MTRPLDFLIIGAQKCATTTLFEHLRAHPQVQMPLEKEVPFFTRPGAGEAEWEQFCLQVFGEDRGQLRGKATPQYMGDPGSAQRIATLMPDVKLVAILRDPVERTWSHYQMGRRRGTESAGFDSAVRDLLEPRKLERARQLPVPTHAGGYEPESDFYVAWSEYGRILNEYAKHFAPSQILVLYTEDLEQDPAGTLDRLLEFIGLPPGFRPESLGDVIHKGGSSNRVPHGLRVWLRERRWIYALWERVPDERRGRLRFLYEQWNVSRKRQSDGPRLEAATREALRNHFRDDLQALVSLGVRPPPWLGNYR